MILPELPKSETKLETFEIEQNLRDTVNLFRLAWFEKKIGLQFLRAGKLTALDEIESQRLDALRIALLFKCEFHHMPDCFFAPNEKDFRPFARLEFKQMPRASFTTLETTLFIDENNTGVLGGYNKGNEMRACCHAVPEVSRTEFESVLNEVVCEIQNTPTPRAEPSPSPAPTEQPGENKCNVPSTEQGRQLGGKWRGYNIQTAKQIADALPIAYKAWNDETSGKWGAAIIARKASLSLETVSRYLAVFRAFGLTQIDSIPLPQAMKRSPRKRAQSQIKKRVK